MTLPLYVISLWWALSTWPFPWWITLPLHFVVFCLAGGLWNAALAGLKVIFQQSSYRTTFERTEYVRVEPRVYAKAVPPRVQRKDWQDVLGLSSIDPAPTEEYIRTRYKSLVKEANEKGGTALRDLNVARDKALVYFGYK